MVERTRAGTRSWTVAKIGPKYPVAAKLPMNHTT